MNYRVESTDGITVLTLKESHLDHSLSALLKAELIILIGQGEGPLIIDLSSVRTCDSDGLSALLVAQRTLNDSGRSLKLVGAKSEIKQLVRISQLSATFDMAPSVRAARSAFSSPKRNRPVKKRAATKRTTKRKR